MAEKDIRLVIKAKNEATKAIESVSDALKDLVSQNSKTTKSAKEADSVLGKLGDEFKRLSAEISGLSALNKVAAELDRAAAALGKLEQEAKSASDDLERVTQESKQAAEESSRLRAQSEELAKSQEAQAEAVKKARKEMRAANKELASVQRALDRVNERAARHASKSAWSNAAASAQAILEGELATARAAADAAQATYEKLNAEYLKTKSTLASVNTELQNATKHEAALRTETERLARAAQKTADALQKGRTELAEIQRIASDTAAKLGNVSINQEKIAEATQKANEALQRAATLQAAMARFSTGGGGFADPRTAEAIRKQRAEVEKAREAYEVLNAEVRRLTAEIKANGGPTVQQAQALREVSAAAREARFELQRQLDTLRRMPGSLHSLGGIRGIFQAIYGESRKAMSLTQRLRGEVLSLSTAYFGLYGAINHISGVIGAYQKLEAAQNRIGVVLGQNQSAVNTELQWLERQASRLGIEFGILADEYSKFAVAAQAANWASESTRKVFLAVAEAARVNKASTEQMSGIFLALQQMISKGKVSSEELRRQLGDRLAGAFNIFADALGLSASQLDELMQKGEVLASETNLLAFADELNRRFGPQLADSLRSTTALMGQFSNEIYQARLRVGEGGFIKAFNEALEEMIGYFRSREGRDFFLSLGSALGSVTRAVTFLIRNVEALFEIFKLLVAFKITQWLVKLSGGVDAFNAKIIRARDSLIVFGSSLNATKTAAAALLGSVLTLGRALSRLFPAAALTALAYGIEFAIGKLVGGVDEATRAVDEHKRLMEEILTAYDKAVDKSRDWVKSVKNVTLIDVERNFAEQLRAFEEARDNLRKKLSSNALGGLSGLLFDDADVRKVRALVDSFDSKKIDEFIRKVQRLNAEVTSLDAKKMLQEIYDLAKAYKESGERVGEAAVLAEQYGSKLEEVGRVIDETGKTLDDLTRAAQGNREGFSSASGSVEVYQAALEKLKGFVKETADEMKRMKELAEIDAEYVKAVEAIGNQRGWRAKLAELGSARARAIDAVNARYYESDYRKMRATPQGEQMERIVANAVRIAEELRISAKDLLTVISYETGGTFDPWKVGPTTKWGQHIGLIQMGEPQRAKYGYTRDASIEKLFNAIRDYLKDAGVTAGTNLLDLYSAVNAGRVGRHNASDAAAGGAPGTVRDKVFGQMDRHADRADAILKAYDDIVDRAKEHSQELRKQAEEREKASEATKKQIADNEFEISQQRLKLEGKEKEAFIEDHIRKAREKNPFITEQELGLIRQQAEELWNLNNALSEEEKKKKAIEEVQNRITQLEEKRSSLEQLRALQAERGDIEAMQRTDAAIERVNQQLLVAIQKAREFWQAMGGPDAEIALTNLAALELRVQRAGQKAVISGAQITEMMASGITNAFDRFAQAIANGEKAIVALRDAFLQFAADFLIEIGKMIVRVALLKMLQGIGGFLSGGINSLFGFFHTGGVVGSTRGSKRAVSPLWFANAMAYHTGGIAGLKPDEVPAILKVGEEVLTENDPRHRANGGTVAQPPVVKVVNAFDSGDVVSQGLSTAVGEQAFINLVRANRSTLREALGVA